MTSSLAVRRECAALRLVGTLLGEALQRIHRIAVLGDEVVDVLLPGAAGMRPGRVRRIMQKVSTMVFGARSFQDVQRLVEVLNHLFREPRLHAEGVRTLLGANDARRRAS